MPHSNYAKIFDLLTELAQENESREIFELAEEIHDRQIESFAIWRPGPEPGTPTVKAYCSPKSIRRLIRFASDLGFVEIGEGQLCSLTSSGQRALLGDNYASTLGTRLVMYLNEHAGVSYSDLKDTIVGIRRPEVPLFDTIYRKVSSQWTLQIGEGRFRMVLYLIERCGLLTTLTKKIYFAPETEVWHS